MAMASLAVGIMSCGQKELEVANVASLLQGTGLLAQIYRYDGSGSSDTERYETYVGEENIPHLNFNYKNGVNPLPMGLPAGTKFTMVATGQIRFPKSGTYRFCLCSNEGQRITIGNDMFSDHLENGNNRMWQSSTYAVDAGDFADIQVTHYTNNPGSAHLSLYWIEGTDACYDPMVATTYACEPGVDIIPSHIHPVPAGAYYPPSESYLDIFKECKVTPTYVTEAEAPDPTLPNTKKALQLLENLTGKRFPLFDRLVTEVKQLLDQGKPIEAARLIMDRDPDFYDVKVADIFKPFSSTQRGSMNVPVNDAVATGVGIVRDGLDARLMLYGDFLYRIKGEIVGNAGVFYGRRYLLESNLHYDFIDAIKLPLKCALEKLSPTSLFDLPNGFRITAAEPDPTQPSGYKQKMKDLPNPAGMISSRGLQEAYSTAGTGRRNVLYSFQDFMCADIEKWRYSEYPDDLVRGDVDRSPGGDLFEYAQNCKGCHGALDGLSRAFSEYHFENGIFKYVPFFMGRNTFDTNESEDNTKISFTSAGGFNTYIPTHRKNNHNILFNPAMRVYDTEFVNNTPLGPMGGEFGFTVTEGTGPQEFGAMLATSARFPQCMALRTYESICKQDVFKDTVDGSFDPQLEQYVKQLGDSFADAGYDMKKLIEAVAVSCMGNGA